MNWMRATLFLALASLMCFSASPAWSQTEDGPRLEGFLRTYIATRIYEEADFLAARNRARVNLTYSYGSGRIVLSNDVRNEFRPGGSDSFGLGTIEYDLREAYMDFFGPSVDFRFGRQQIVWGEADGTFITDLLSPLDLSEFLSKPFDEIRLGVPALNVTFFPGDLALNTVFIPGAFPAVLAPTGTPWDPIPSDILAVNQWLPVQRQPADLPEFTLLNSELAFRASFYGVPLTTLSVMAMTSWDRMPGFRKSVRSESIDGIPTPTHMDVTPFYYRRFAAGATLSTAHFDPFVFRGEVAYHGRRAYDLDTAPPPGYGQEPSTDPAIADYIRALQKGFVDFRPTVAFMTGIEYLLPRNMVRLQFLGNYYSGERERITVRPFEPAVSLLWNGRTVDEALAGQLFAYVMFTGDFWINPEIRYAVTDVLTASTGVQLFGGYGPADRTTLLSFRRFDDNDFAYLRVQFSF